MSSTNLFVVKFRLTRRLTVRRRTYLQDVNVARRACVLPLIVIPSIPYVKQGRCVLKVLKVSVCQVYSYVHSQVLTPRQDPGVST